MFFNFFNKCILYLLVLIFLKLTKNISTAQEIVLVAPYEPGITRNVYNLTKLGGLLNGSETIILYDTDDENDKIIDLEFKFLLLNSTDHRTADGKKNKVGFKPRTGSVSLSIIPDGSPIEDELRKRRRISFEGPLFTDLFTRTVPSMGDRAMPLDSTLKIATADVKGVFVHRFVVQNSSNDEQIIRIRRKKRRKNKTNTEKEFSHLQALTAIPLNLTQFNYSVMHPDENTPRWKTRNKYIRDNNVVSSDNIKLVLNRTKLRGKHRNLDRQYVSEIITDYMYNLSDATENIYLRTSTTGGMWENNHDSCKNASKNCPQLKEITFLHSLSEEEPIQRVEEFQNDNRNTGLKIHQNFERAGAEGHMDMEHNMQMHHMQGEEGSMGEVMVMSSAFHTGSNETIVFKWWKADSPITMVVAFVVVYLLAFFSETLKSYNSFLRCKNSTKSSIADTGPRHPQASLRLEPPTEEGSRYVNFCSLRIAYFMWRVFLYILQMFISYILMLIFMTLNIWLCLALILGASTGYTVYSSTCRSSFLSTEFSTPCH